MILYQIDNKSKVRSWEISTIDNIITISHGLLNGAKQIDEEHITEGKAGRTLEQQIISRVNSRINKQLAKGYHYTIEDAEKNKGKNELQFYKPMLAQQFDKVKNINTEGAVLQHKLDGNRMLVTRTEGKLMAYTRNGKPVETLHHILDELEWLEEGQTLDGEVYTHGVPLKDINSWMRRYQDNTYNLKYHIYDVLEDKTFTDRFDPLLRLDTMDNVIIEPYYHYDQATMYDFLTKVRLDGYEGLMLRLDGYGYEPGKRSKSLLKIKKRQDAEAVVVDIEKDKAGLGVLTLRMQNGKTFKCVAPGDQVSKRLVATLPDNYIGKQVTFSYAYITDYGIPFHPVSERWRD